MKVVFYLQMTEHDSLWIDTVEDTYILFVMYIFLFVADHNKIHSKLLNSN